MTSKGSQLTSSIEDTRTAGPWSFSAPNRGPTAAQVRRARIQAVGGARKRCRMGKNCSAACISQGKVCLVEFPEPIQDPLSQVREYIVKKNNLQPGSIQERRVNAAIDQLTGVTKVSEGREIDKQTGLKKPEVEWRREEARSERRGLTWKEVQGLKERRDLIADAEGSEAGRKALLKEATSRGVRIPRKELEMVYDALPESIQKSAANAGVPGSGAYYGGLDANGKPIFKSGPNKERGLAVLDLYLRQAGTDGYLSRGGKVWALKDLSVEHIVPLNKGGLDVPSNWILVRKGTNVARQSEDLRNWINKLPKSEAEYKTYLSKYADNKRKTRVRKVVGKAIDPRGLSDKEMFNKGAKPMALMFASENKEKPGSAPTTFTKGWYSTKDKATPGREANSGPPAPFKGALGLIAKDQGLDKAREVNIKIREPWNTEWKRQGSISKQEAFDKMVSIVKQQLTPEQYDTLFLPAATKWATRAGFDAPSSTGEAPKKMSAMDAHLARFLK